MRRVFRLASAIGLGLLGLCTVSAVAAYLWLRTSVPVTEGILEIAGPGAPIQVIRDSRGIPHIHAESQADAYFALGFVHAQDRMWQMEMARRLGRGRLAEIGGKRFVPQDRMMRTLSLWGLAAENLAFLSKETRAAIEAYTRGVNAWIGSHRGAWPPEYYIAGITPMPWTPRDSLLWGRLMGMRLSGNWRSEALRARLLRVMEPKRVEALWPPYPQDAPVSIPAPLKSSSVAPAPPDPNAPVLSFGEFDIGAMPPAAGSASNAWAVAGSRTSSGMPILAGDPHLGFRAPNIWYLARIKAPGLSISGATLPGVPFHILGHNGAIAWTLTTTGADTQDLVVEKPDPGNSSRYLTPSGTLPVAQRQEEIAVRGSDAVAHTVRWTRNGPVVSHSLDSTAGNESGGAFVALRAAALEPDDRTADALFRLNRARNWDEFRAALALFHSPVQNFLYADREGHVGLQVAGRVPLRKGGDGFAPVSGESRDHEWAGYVPFAELPSELDPAAGTIVNANNRVIGPGYAHFISRNWDAPYRARRISDLLGKDRRHDLSGSRAIQLDTLSLAAREIVPLLLAATPPGERISEALGLLESWDGRIVRAEPQPLILNAWLREISAALLADDLGPLFGHYRRMNLEFLKHALERDPSWCDDRTTEPEETCGAVLADALGRALDGLAARYGPDIWRWRWGDVHIARFRHSILGHVPLLRHFADIEIPTDGDDHTVNRGTTRPFSRRAPYTHVHGATLRAIYDLADLDRSLFMQPTGQSGNPLSPHYRDMTADWRDGRYLTIPETPQGQARRLRLVPPGLESGRQ